MFSFISGNAFIDMLLMFQEESCFVKKHSPIGGEAACARAGTLGK